MIAPEEVNPAGAPDVGSSGSIPPIDDEVKILIIDNQPDGRFFISKTLHRKFPKAAIVECQTSESAFKALRSDRIDAVVCHRTSEHNPIDLVRALRQISPGIPLLMVSGFDRRQDALAAGATGFLHYNEWLNVGMVVAELIKRPS